MQTKERASLAVAATTLGEFWRDQRGLAESRFGLLRPSIVDVDERLAKRAGVLLKKTGGKNVMDAIVVALAERLLASHIYTSDVDDIGRLLGAAADWDCDAVAV